MSWWLNSSSVILILGAVASIIGGLFYGCRNSRCEEINCCCGMCECKRKLLSVEEQELAMRPATPPPSLSI